ncbi:M15 family metallopeptidase [Vibrio ostreicida]|uniref:M15 family metallopeptidase n=1 Tax=Vibrio ostreicida TaxID=526588 RepID=UPI000970C017|nr:M15 family metallopeptidase [Vibrio ostreicida]
MSPEQLTGQVTTHLVETMVGQKSFLVHPNVSEDLLALKQSAAEAGFNLNIASGFRDFERQRTIWDNKMSGRSAILDSKAHRLNPTLLSDTQKVSAILRWSALPGASRHHWGTDFDVFDRHSLPKEKQLKLEPWEYHSGHQSDFYQWLSNHVNMFGFFFPYAKDQGGVSPEPWHISHAATAKSCIQLLTIKVLKQQLQSASFLGKDIVLVDLKKIYTQFINNIEQQVP